MPDFLGYTSSVILVVTIVVQIRKQWIAESTEGVSPWLFIGQCAASTGFLVYSVLIHSMPFVITNGVLAAAALVGLAVWGVKTRREKESEREVWRVGSGRAKHPTRIPTMRLGMPFAAHHRGGTSNV